MMAEKAPAHRLIAATVAAVALVQLALHGALLARGTELIVSALTIDDTYYYLGTAWNLKLLGFPTFDGIHPTNGVQLLWFWVLAGLAWLVPTKATFLQVALAAGALANVACHAVIWRFARLLGRPRLALWMSGLWLLQSLGSVAYSRGLENSLHALVFWCVAWQGTAFVAEVRAGRPGRLGIVTALLILNAWSRIDAGVLSLLVFAFCGLEAWRSTVPGSERRRLAGRVAGAAGAAGAAGGVQLALFHWMGGSWLPVSALVKAGLEVESWAETALRAARLGLPAAVPPLVAAAFLGVYWLVVGRGRSGDRPAGGTVPAGWVGRPDAEEAAFLAWNRLWPVLLAGVVVHAALVRGGSYWYNAPSHVFWSVTLALLAHEGVAWLRGADSGGPSSWWSRVPPGTRSRLAAAPPALFLAGAVAVTASRVAVRWQMEPNFYALRARVGEWISRNLPPDAVLASWDAGQLGYFSEQSLINLDGLANSLDYFRNVFVGPVPLEDYLVAEGVDYIIDRSDGVGFIRLYDGRMRDRRPDYVFQLKDGEPRVLIWRFEPPYRANPRVRSKAPRPPQRSGNSGYYLDRSRAGTPTDVVLSGTSATTAAPAPTVACAPTRTPGKSALPIPTTAPSATFTPPPRRAPGATWTKSATRQSWSTEAPVLMMTWRPISVSGWSTAPAKTTEPTPRRTERWTVAAGWTAEIQGKSSSAARRRRSRLLPTASTKPSASSGRASRRAPRTGTPRSSPP